MGGTPKMIWQDMFINRVLTKDELSQALLKIFNVEIQQICFTKSMFNDEPPLSETDRILCESFICKEEFPFRLVIYLRDHQLLPKDDLIPIFEFSQLLHCFCIISDKSINPYSMILIKDNKTQEQIFIDLAKYEDCEEYEII